MWGILSVSVTIGDSLTGGSASTATTATVADAPLTMTGGFEFGDAFTNPPSTFTVATFTDANPGAPLTDFMASINWGDGSSSTSASYIQAGPDGLYSIVAGHNYINPFPNSASPQTYTVTVTLTDVDGASASVTDTVVVGVVAAEMLTSMGGWSFYDANPYATTSDFVVNGQAGMASINWGDGTSSVVPISGGPGNGSGPVAFSIQPTHIYADSLDQPGGVYQVSVTASDVDGNVLTWTEYVSVVRPQLSVAVANVDIASNLTVSNVQVAAFTDPSPSDGTSEFTAQINWGDGSTSSGVIQEVSPGLFQVLGSHTYAAEGWYTMTVQISQGWGGQAADVKGAGENGGTPKISFYAYLPNPQPGAGLIYQPVDTLKVGKWENAFNNPKQEPTVKNNFISLDPARFWVQVQDPVAYKKENTIQVFVESSSDIGHYVTLNKSTTPNWFGGELQTVNGGKNSFSQPLLLMSKMVDVDAGGAQALEVRLGDTVRAIYSVNGAVKADTWATVPVLRDVYLHINILRVEKGGQPVASIAKVMFDVRQANRIYAAAGIHLEIEKIQYVNPPPNVVLQNNANKVQNGLECRFYFFPVDQLQVMVNGHQVYRMTKEEQNLLGAKNLWPPDTNIIKVYYVNYFANKDGVDKGLFGEAFQVGKAMNAIYANSVIISANDEKYQTLAHEVGHILLNNGSHDTRIVNLMFGTGTRGNALPWVNGAPTDSRRITSDEAKTMLNNQQLALEPT